ncbi:induced myeloid leukemia cell differentiation protein Mcl-1 [Bombina bombina]|uniref:induced myeloid leukemia cell differentiation protein Mcl-1 n=1 Tax=Bombina bombina TaxID=8345 RepID=UPI00235A4878|nr:induced myeloid leukemia cell differentiation protein Mcl-1 [Bombina bombina]
MMNHSIMYLNRKTGMLPLQLCCGNGGLTKDGVVGSTTEAATMAPVVAGSTARHELAPLQLSQRTQLEPIKSNSLLALNQFDEWEKRSEDSVMARMGYNACGSLPCSQEEIIDELGEEEDSRSVSRGSTSPLPSPTYHKDALHQETLQLFFAFFMEYACGEKAALKRPGPIDAYNRKALDTLLRVGGSVIEKHKLAFQGMLHKMPIRSSEDLHILSDLPSMVFSDGITNWGRIVTLISFGAFVAKHLKDTNHEDYISKLAEQFTDYLMISKRDWIVQQNGWAGFVDFFHIEDYEGGLRTLLMAFAGFAGISASLAYMIR